MEHQIKKNNHLLLRNLFQIPPFLYPNFTYDSRVPVSDWYFGSLPGEFHTVNWSWLWVEFLRLRSRLGYPAATYGPERVDKIWEQISHGGHMEVKGKHVLVVGSEVLRLRTKIL